jgi:predicted O-methyltransferase YrrM
MRELSHAARDWLRRIRKLLTRLFFTPAIRRDRRLRLPPGILLDAVRNAPEGRRRRLLHHIRAARSVMFPHVSAELCEINSLANFERAYTDLAAKLGRAGKTVPPDELEFLRSVVSRRRMYYPMTIGVRDYLFLTAFISILAPARVIEIGTLTGFSAAIIAGALRRQHRENTAVWVDTIDIRPDCAIDETRPTGFEINESFPELASMIRLHVPHDSSVVSNLVKRDELEVAFIDGDHRHPMPLLDLLRLAPYMRSGGWIILHDLGLGTTGQKSTQTGQGIRVTPSGPEWLFVHWPFRKISGGKIGAVQLPDEKAALIPFALRLMSIPFETTGRTARMARRGLYESFAELI